MQTSWALSDVSAWNVITVLTGFLLCIGTISLLANNASARLSHVPGPYLAKYTNAYGVFIAFKLSKARSGPVVASFSRDLEKKHGKTVRTGPNAVTILDPRAIQPVYGVRAKLDKSDSYEPFRMAGITTSLPAIVDETTHSTYRKLVSSSYTMSALKEYEPYIDEMTKRWLAVFEKFAESGKPMDISLWSHYYCFEVVAMMTLGRPLGFLEGKDAYNLIKATSAFSWYIGLTSHMPWLHKVFQENVVMRRAGPPPIAYFAETVVRERIEKFSAADPGRPDFLSHFLDTHKQQPLMDEKQVVISVVGNLLAGSLSPSSAMKELTRYLATHPDSQTRLHAELQRAGITSTPVAFSGVKDLPYLEGVIREALRLHPQIIVRQERVAPAGGMTLPDGTYLPAGTKVGALGQAMTLNRDVFGEDADEFAPERWLAKAGESLEAYTERRNKMERTDMTFGHGSRSCIGKNITMLEFFKAVASLTLSFEFEVVPGRDISGTHIKARKRLQ